MNFNNTDTMTSTMSQSTQKTSPRRPRHLPLHHAFIEPPSTSSASTTTSPTSTPSLTPIPETPLFVQHIPRSVHWQLAPPTHTIHAIQSALENNTSDAASVTQRQQERDRGDEQQQIVNLKFQEKMGLFLSVCSFLLSVQCILPKML